LANNWKGGGLIWDAWGRMGLAWWGRMGWHGAARTAWGRMGRMGTDLQDPRDPRRADIVVTDICHPSTEYATSSCQHALPT
jgi:hypothetical protein